MIHLKDLIHTSIFTLFLSVLPVLAQPEPTLAWVKRIGDNSSSNSQIFSPVVAVDAQGNSYMSVYATGPTFTVDGITISATHTNSSSVGYGYIAKYNPNGQIIWAKSTTNILAALNSAGTYSNYNKLLVDEQGNIYLCGLYSFNTFRFSAIDNYLLTDMSVPSPISGSQYNMFLAKLDADGSVLWVQKTAHPEATHFNTKVPTNEIHFDLEGNINMAGGFRDSIQFSPGNTLITNTGETAVFLAKYSPEGEVLQTKKLAGETYPENQFGTEQVRADASGNLYRWSNRTGNNPKRLYRYDEEGELLDSLDLNINFGFASGYYGTMSNLNAFAVSPVGDIYIGGAYVGNITINGSTYNGSGSNNSDAVLFKLTAPNYEMEWVNTHQTIRNDAFRQIVTDGIGNVYATGEYRNAQEGASVVHKYTSNGTLIWEKRLQGLSTPQNPTTGWVTTSSFCQSQNGGNIWIGGQFSLNAYFSANDHFITPANNHYNGFLAQYGVCSTANPVITTPPATTLCGQESITLSANLSNPGLTYFWSTPNGTVAIGGSETTTELTVTQSGKYYLVAQEDAECYGKSQEIWVTQGNLPDVTITENNNTLTTTETTQGTTYQWLDCNNGYAQINGENEISFTPIQNGSYAVVLTSQHGCTDTSICITIHSVGIDEIENSELIEVYPNPATDEINIQSSFDIQSVRILDLQGKELIQTKGDKVKISNLSSGVYIVEINTTKGTAKKAFIKE